MPGQLEGKVAIITGGSKGIGAATTRLFVSEGAKVMINYSSDTAAAAALVSSLGASSVSSVQADAGTIAGIEQIVSATVSAFGRIDIVVANAALLMMRDLMSTTPEDFDKMFAVNVRGPYFLAQKAVPHFPATGGKIVMLSTSVTRLSQVSPSYLLYTTTKAAIEQMVRIMNKELGKKGITVNAIAPGPTNTELFKRGKSEELIRTMEGWHPQDRIGEPVEIARAILFASTEASSWVSGQTIFTNGGMV